MPSFLQNIIDVEIHTRDFLRDSLHYITHYDDIREERHFPFRFSFFHCFHYAELLSRELKMRFSLITLSLLLSSDDWHNIYYHAVIWHYDIFFFFFFIVLPFIVIATYEIRHAFSAAFFLFFAAAIIFRCPHAYFHYIVGFHYIRYYLALLLYYA